MNKNEFVVYARTSQREAVRVHCGGYEHARTWFIAAGDHVAGLCAVISCAMTCLQSNLTSWIWSALYCSWLHADSGEEPGEHVAVPRGQCHAHQFVCFCFFFSFGHVGIFRHVSFSNAILEVLTEQFLTWHHCAGVIMWSFSSGWRDAVCVDGKSYFKIRFQKYLYIFGRTTALL